MPVNASTVKVTAGDRLGMTLFFAIFFHGIIILGVTFITSPSAQQKPPPSMDIILVNTSNGLQPEKADYLAQVSQDGGGNSDKKLRPTDMFTAPTLVNTPGIAMQQQSQTQPSQRQQQDQRVITAQKSRFATQSDRANRLENLNEKLEQLQRNEMPARLAHELSLTYQQFAQKPREKFINARTREFTAATYMRNWVDRVERLGNADYPDEAIRNKLSGTLVLDVVINSDGSLSKIELRQSSGHQVLDDAAKRIVRMASPYDPFPHKLKQEADVIHITRSWEFLSDNVLTSY